MVQITEDYVSFEIAKLLKEKGFDEPVVRFYDNKGEVAEIYHLPQNKSITGDTYKCPTLQLTMKWLREIHHIMIDVYYDSDDSGWVSEYYDNNLRDYVWITVSDIYEEAAEAAIKYCLENLI